MPAPVPPGYTRGPLVWMGAPVDREQEEAVYQWLWREAGGFGARLVLITTEAAHVATVTALQQKWDAWESDHVAQIVALDRRSACNPAHIAPVEQATAIVLVGENPFHCAATLGGTPLAQAIRRANARSKLVAGSGAAAAYLCQHIISPGISPSIDTGSNHDAAATLRGAVTFGPGLGLVNRLVMDADPRGDMPRRLLAAVATNPYLIAVGLVAASAAILYPDNTLYASGPNPLTLVDGQAIEAADSALNLDVAAADAVVGAHHYTLHLGDSFNLDDHTLRPAGEVDLPATGPVTSVF